jgi:hypothetical protein
MHTYIHTYIHVQLKAMDAKLVSGSADAYIHTYIHTCAAQSHGGEASFWFSRRRGC